MKYLKKFESSEDSFTQPSFLDPWYPHKIDTDIVMDVLTQLKDDKYDVDIQIISSDIIDHFPNSIRFSIKIFDLDKNVDNYLDNIYKVIHQMLNYYYAETKHEIYLILYPSDLDGWDVYQCLDFHLNPIEDIKRHLSPIFWLMTKNDLFPVEVNSKKNINHSKVFPKKTNSDYDHTFYENKISPFALSAIGGEEEIFDDVKDVFQDIIDEYNLLKVPTDTGRLPEGISYHNRFVPGWIDSANNPHFCFYQIEIYVTGKDINSKREYLSTGSTMTHDLKDFYERIRQMGFKVVELSNNISLYSNGPLKIKIYK